MSSPTPPVRADRPSLEAIKGLLERNLVDRAVALSESRWPGSGPLVELSYEWAQLPPAARRDRLATIGPEELGRLRGVADLQPDLARVLDDLETRGIIPPAAPAIEEPAVARELTREEQVVDAVLDLAEEQIVRAADDLEPRLLQLRQQFGATVADDFARPTTLEIPADPIEGVPNRADASSAAFVAEVTEQRLRAAEHANEALERVRATIERSATRLRDRPVESPRIDASRVPERQPGDTPEATAVAADQSPQHAGTAPEQPATTSEVVSRLRTERIVALEGDNAHEVEIEPIAMALESTTTVLVPDAIGRRSFYGGLVRKGRDIEVEVGAFPRSLAAPGLTIVRGRILPSTIARIRDGYVDIPGTRASTRVHPEARLLVLPDERD